ncbi:MAG: 3-isopropylmalate dehydrogenase [Bacteroidales bacterium]|nr:3-isopropylmalate dehydrogenase [Bacteroidales bacterium]
MEVKHIALLPGDGIGPEVMAEAVKVLDAVGRRFGRSFCYETALVGATAIAAVGNPYPEGTHRICLASDAVLFGAVGDPAYDLNPKAGIRPEQGLLAMRKQLGLFANIRPTVCYPALRRCSPLRPERLDGVDFVVFRELTGGLYFGRRGREGDDGAFDTCIYSREEIRRIARLAFETAMGRRGRLTLVDKSNILETSRLWRDEVQQLQADYPGVQLDFLFVDNAAMQLVTNPAVFDVILTENMFGDILTDLAAAVAGSMGILPSASLGSGHCLFEPVHGSYPQAKGRNIANPVAMILSAAMMLDYAFGWTEEAKAVQGACEQSFAEGFVTQDLAPEGAGHTTSEVGDWIAARI